MSKFVMRQPMMQHRPKNNRVHAQPSPELMKFLQRKMFISYAYRQSVQRAAVSELLERTAADQASAQ